MAEDQDNVAKPAARPASAARADRVAAALRENLRRRKEQARGRAGIEPVRPQSDEPEPD